MATKKGSIQKTNAGSLNWFKNVSKSLGYTSSELVRNITPSISEFASSNIDYAKELTDDFREMKSNGDRFGKLFNGTQQLKIASDAYKNAIEDIKSGNIHNQERIDSLYEDDFDLDGFGMEDFSFDGSTSDIETEVDPETKVPNITIKNIQAPITRNNLMVKAVEKQTEMNLRASQTNMDVQTTLATNQAMLTRKIGTGTLQGLETINENLALLVNFQNDSMSKYVGASLKYYEESLSSMNATLKELQKSNGVGTQTTSSQYQSSSQSTDPMDNVFLSNGGLDLRNYMSQVKKNLDRQFSENMFLQPLKMMFSDTDTLKSLAASPLSFISTKIVTTLIPQFLQTSMQNLDKSFSTFFPALMMKINRAALSSNNPFIQILGEIFGASTRTKTNIDLSRYNRGQIPFDGETKKSIVEVIPGYLRKILSAVSGQEEVAFDYNEGKFKTVSAMKEEFDRERNMKALSPFMEAMDDIKKRSDAFLFDSMDERKKFNEGITKFFLELNKQGQLVNPNLVRDKQGNIKDELSEVYNFDNDTGMKNLFRQLILTLPKNQQMKMFGRDVIESRRNVREMMENAEQNSNLNNVNVLFNELGLNDHLTTNKDGTKVVKKGFGLFNPTDKFGKSSLDYLRDITRTLLEGIRVYPIGGMGGSSDGNSSLTTSAENILKNQDSKRKYMNDSARKITKERQAKEAERLRTLGLSDDEIEKEQGRGKRLVGPMELATLSPDEIVNQLGTREEARKKYKETSGQQASITQWLGKFLKGDTQEKYNLVREKIDGFLKKPAELLRGVFDRVDNTLYSVVFGKPGEDGNVSFFDKTLASLGERFDKMGVWIKTSVMDPIKESLIGEDGIITKMKDTEFYKSLRDNTKRFADWMFGKPDSEGVRRDGLLANTGNNILDMWDAAKYYFSGKGYVNRAGEKFDDNDESVLNQARGVFKQFGKDLKHYLVGDKKAEDEDNKSGVLTGAVNGLQEGFVNFRNAIFGPKEGKSGENAQKSFAEMKDVIKQRAPKALAWGTVGGGVGLATMGSMGLMGSLFLPGGPIGAAVVGTTLGFLSQSDRFKDWMFGEKNANNERIGGFISKSTQDFFKKNRAYMVGGATLGVLKPILGAGILPSFLLPGGPIAGALFGVGTAMLVRSEGFQKMMFGEKDEDGKRTGGLLQRSFSKFKGKLGGEGNNLLGNMGAGALGGAGMAAIVGKMGLMGAMLTPAGPIGGAVLGAAAGIALSSDRWKKALFGEWDDKTGLRKGGMLGKFTNWFTLEVQEPLKNQLQKININFQEWFTTKISNPFADAIAPMKQAFKDMTDSMGEWFKKGWDSFKDKIGTVFEENVGKPFGKFMNENVMKPLKGFLGKIITGVGKIFAPIVEAPVKVLSSIGNGFRRRQEERGVNRHIEDNWNDMADFSGRRERGERMGLFSTKDKDGTKIGKGVFGRLNDMYFNKEARDDARYGEHGASYAREEDAKILERNQQQADKFKAMKDALAEKERKLEIRRRAGYKHDYDNFDENGNDISRIYNITKSKSGFHRFVRSQGQEGGKNYQKSISKHLGVELIDLLQVADPETFDPSNLSKAQRKIVQRAIKSGLTGNSLKKFMGVKDRPVEDVVEETKTDAGLIKSSVETMTDKLTSVFKDTSAKEPIEKVLVPEVKETNKHLEKLIHAINPSAKNVNLQRTTDKKFTLARNITKHVKEIKNVENIIKPKVDGSHADGLDNVPFDNYKANLHQGEMVLPKEDAKELRLAKKSLFVKIAADVKNISAKITDLLNVTIKGFKPDTSDSTVESAPVKKISLLKVNTKSPINKLIDNTKGEKETTETEDRTETLGSEHQVYADKMDKRYGTGKLSKTELMQRIATDVRIVASEVRGQLDGVGGNVFKMRKLLQKQLGVSDEDMTGSANRDRVGLFGRLRRMMFKPLDAIREKITNVVGVVVEKVRSFGEAIFNVGKAIVMVPVNIVKGVGKALASVTKELYKGLKAVGTEIIKLPGKIVGVVGSAFDAIGHAVKALGPALAKTLEGVSSFITSGFKFLGGALKGAGDALHGFGKGVGKIFTSIGEGTAKFIGSLGTITGKIASSVGSFLQSTVQMTLDTGKMILDTAGKAIGGTAKLLTDFTLKTVKQVGDTLTSVGKAFWDVVSSPFKFISKSLGKLLGKANVQEVKVIGGTLDAVKEVGTVHEPSKISSHDLFDFHFISAVTQAVSQGIRAVLPLPVIMAGGGSGGDHPTGGPTKTVRNRIGRLRIPKNPVARKSVVRSGIIKGARAGSIFNSVKGKLTGFINKRKSILPMNDTIAKMNVLPTSIGNIIPFPDGKSVPGLLSRMTGATFGGTIPNLFGEGSFGEKMHDLTRKPKLGRDVNQQMAELAEKEERASVAGFRISNVGLLSMIESNTRRLADGFDEVKDPLLDFMKFVTNWLKNFRPCCGFMGSSGGGGGGTGGGGGAVITNANTGTNTGTGTNTSTTSTGMFGGNNKDKKTTGTDKGTKGDKPVTTVTNPKGPTVIPLPGSKPSKPVETPDKKGNVKPNTPKTVPMLPNVKEKTVTTPKGPTVVPFPNTKPNTVPKEEPLKPTGKNKNVVPFNRERQVQKIPVQQELAPAVGGNQPANTKPNGGNSNNPRMGPTGTNEKVVPIRGNGTSTVNTAPANGSGSTIPTGGNGGGNGGSGSGSGGGTRGQVYQFPTNETAPKQSLMSKIWGGVKKGATVAGNVATRGKGGKVVQAVSKLFSRGGTAAATTQAAGNVVKFPGAAARGVQTAGNVVKGAGKGIGTALKVGAKATGSALGSIPGVNLLFGGINGAFSYGRAGETFGVPEGEKATIGQKTAAALGGTAIGLIPGVSLADALMGGKISDATSRILYGTGQGIGALGKGAGNLAVKGWNGLTSFFTGDKKETDNEGNETVKQGPNVFQKMGSGITNTWNNVANSGFGQGVAGIGKGIGAIASENWKTAKSVGGYIGDTAKNIGTTAWDGIKTVGSFAGNRLADLGKTAWDSTAPVRTTIANAGKDLWNSTSPAREAIGSAIGTGVKAVKNTTTNIMDTAKSGASLLWNAGSKIVGDKVNAAKNVTSNVIGGAKKIGSGIAEKAGTVASAGKEFLSRKFEDEIAAGKGIINFGKNAIGLGEGTWAEGIHKNGETIRNLGSNVGSYLNKKGSDIKTGITNTWNKFTNFEDGVVIPGLKVGMKTVGAVADRAVGNTIDGAKMLGKGIANSVQNKWEGIKDVGSTIKDGASNIFGKLFNKNDDESKGSASGGPKALSLASNVTKLTSKGITNGKELVTDTLENLKSGLSTIGDTVSTKVEDIKKSTSDVWNNTKETVGKKWDETKTKFTESVDNIKSKTTDVWNNTKESVGKTWDETKTKFTDSVDTIKSKTSDVWNNTKETVGKKWDETKTSFNDSVETIKSKTSDVWNSTKETVGKKWDETKTKFTESVDNIKSKTSDVWNNTKETVGKKWDETKTKFTETVDSIKTKTSDVWNNTKETVGKKWDETKTKFTDSVDKIKSKTTTIWNSTKETVGKKWDDTKKTVTDKATGMYNDAKSKFESAKTATSKKWDELKTSVTEKASNMKKDATTKWENAKSQTSTKLSSLAKDTAEKANRMKEDAKKKWENAKTQTTAKLTTLASDAASKAGGIKSAITSALESAKTAVSNALSSVANSKVGKAVTGTVKSVGTSIKNLFTGGPDKETDAIELAVEHGNGLWGMGQKNLNGMVYYSQNDPRWANKSFTSGKGPSFAEAGCGPTTAAMVMSSVTGKEITPVETLKLAQEGGFVDPSRGTRSDFFASAGKKYGVDVKAGGNNAEKIKDQLTRNNPVILRGEGGKAFTDGGHYVVATGLDKDGKIMVNDPMGKQRSIAYEPEDLLKNTTSSYVASKQTDFGKGKIKATFGSGSIVPQFGRGVFDGFRITSPYGWRQDPGGAGRQWHRGIDLVKADRAEIKSFTNGTVVHASFGQTGTGYGGYGNVVAVKDERGYTHLYAHLSSISVNVGNKIKKGRVVGRQGNTGRSFGSHLHYEVREKGYGTDVNPTKYLESYVGNKDFVEDVSGSSSSSSEGSVDVGSMFDWKLGKLGETFDTIATNFLTGENKKVDWTLPTSSSSSSTDSAASNYTNASIKAFSESKLYEGQYADIINKYAKTNDMEPALIAAIIRQESGFNANAKSAAGAQGLMQLMPATARSLGVSNPYDPDDNVMGGSKYIRQQLNSFKDVKLALAAYNAGPGNVRKYGNKVPPFKETQNYVEKVVNNLGLYRGETGNGTGGGFEPRFEFASGQQKEKILEDQYGIGSIAQDATDNILSKMSQPSERVSTSRYPETVGDGLTDSYMTQRQYAKGPSSSNIDSELLGQMIQLLEQISGNTKSTSEGIKGISTSVSTISERKQETTVNATNAQNTVNVNADAPRNANPMIEANNTQQSKSKKDYSVAKTIASGDRL